MRRAMLAITALGAVALILLPGNGASALRQLVDRVSRALDTSTSSSAHAATVTLAGEVLPGIARTRSIGSPKPGVQLTIAVGLSDRDPAGEAALLSATETPGTPQYRHFLTPTEFAARFGPSAGQYHAVQAWLQAGGLTITGTSSARDVVFARGDVAHLDALFGTTIRTFPSIAGSVLANVTAPRVPGDLDILGIVGLNTLQRFAPVNASAPHGTPAQGRILTPQDLWGIYDQPAQNQGQGETMAIIGAGRSETTVAALRQFEAAHQLPYVPVSTTYVGAGPFADLGGVFDIEWQLDTQASTGMAPEVQGEHLYFGPDLSDPSVLADFNQWADDNVAKQASASFGECESSPADADLHASSGGSFGNALEPLAEQTLARANLQGQTLFASTGDTGAYCPTLGLGLNGVTYTGDPRLNYPAASPHVVAVGGTVVLTDSASEAQRNQEIAWTHGGGGNSVFIPAPNFQLNEVLGRCITDPGGGTGATGRPCRGIPDVAAESGDVLGDGYTICDPECGNAEGGTSLSAPLWLGMWTRIQAAAPDSVQGLGPADPILYRLGEHPGTNAPDFYDVTLGSNGLYAAVPGWDNTTGWGSPDVRHLLLDIDGRIDPTNPVLPPPAPVATVSNPGSLVTPAACTPLFVVKPPHTVSEPTGSEDQQLELTSGDIKLSSDAQSLRVLLTVRNGSTTPPSGATGMTWLMDWQYSGVTYFASAQVDVVGSRQFRHGTVSSNSQGTTYTPISVSDTGSIGTGPGALVEIDVPRAGVGSPALGDQLSRPSGATFKSVGTPNLAGGGGTFLNGDTAGPGNDYLVGQTCGQSQAFELPAPSYVAPPAAANAPAVTAAAPTTRPVPAASPPSGSPSRSAVASPAATLDAKGIALHTVAGSAPGGLSLPIGGGTVAWVAIGLLLLGAGRVVFRRVRGEE
ncbi:MAG: S53 family peptidase [Candidatus Dormibacteria bacterium]